MAYKYSQQVLVGKYCEISWYRADVKLIFRVKLIHVLSPKQLKDGDAIH